MSFSANAGIFLKLPWLFLRICRWVLARMALHYKASGLNGSFPMSLTAKKRPLATNSWKWRRMLLVLWAVTCVVGTIWVFFDWKDSSFSRKDEIIDARRVKAQVLRQQFNVSNDEVDALATLFSKSDQRKFLECLERSSSGRPISNGVIYGLKTLYSDREKLERQHGRLVTEDQCPAPGYVLKGEDVLAEDNGQRYALRR